MMRNDTCKKALVLGIIVLFIGMSNLSIAENLLMETQSLQETLSFEHFKNGDSGISLIKLKINEEKGLNDWYVQDVGVNITHESGDIAEIFYQIDGGPEQTYTEPFNLTEDGEDIWLEWRAVDHEGNYSDMDGPFICSIDKTAPKIDLTYEFTGTEPPYNYIFTANASDATSGMERVEFYFNEELQKTVYGPGPTYVWEYLYWPYPVAIWKSVAYDMAGNNDFDIVKDPVNLKVLKSSKFKSGFDKDSSVKSCSNELLISEIVERENNKPTKNSSSDYSSTGVFDPGYVIVVSDRKMGENGWIISGVYIYIFYEKDRIDKVFYQINGGNWTSYVGHLFIYKDGLNVFSWYAVDSEGYSSTPEPIYLKIDKTPPELNLIRKRLEIDKVKIIADVYDETSNIDRVEFNIGSPSEVEFTDYDFPYEWICPGIFNKKVTVSVYDKAGNSKSRVLNTWPYSYYSTNSLVLKFLERFPLLKEVFARLINL